jgi:hypothetical protein
MESSVKILKAIIAVAAVAVVAPYAVRMFSSVARDAARYNRMRRMSGEGPLLEDFGAVIKDIAKAESRAVGDIVDSVASVPADAARYARIKMM